MLNEIVVGFWYCGRLHIKAFLVWALTLNGDDFFLILRQQSHVVWLLVGHTQILINFLLQLLWHNRYHVGNLT